MKSNLLSFIAISSIALFSSSCASIVTKSNQKVTFKGLPGTTVIDAKKNRTIAELGQSGFSTVPVRKQLKAKEIRITKDGYKDESRTMGVTLHPAFFGNILFGGIPGIAIDLATGKMMKYNSKIYDVTLQHKLAPETPTIEENIIPIKVNKEVASKNDMEKSILRWYFDSDPRGARVFYRIISNVPVEVKNTNETYMTTTPIEETRSFNIPGLTYENAQNVTIEFKVSKRGFEDQIKRYNVRQAIDQQEISGFFELVPKN